MTDSGSYRQVQGHSSHIAKFFYVQNSKVNTVVISMIQIGDFFFFYSSKRAGRHYKDFEHWYSWLKNQWKMWMYRWVLKQLLAYGMTVQLYRYLQWTSQSDPHQRARRTPRAIYSCTSKHPCQDNIYLSHSALSYNTYKGKTKDFRNGWHMVVGIYPSTIAGQL